MTKVQQIEMNPASYSVEARRAAAETLRGMARHLWVMANAAPGNFRKASDADQMAWRAEKLEATL